MIVLFIWSNVIIVALIFSIILIIIYLYEYVVKNKRKIKNRIKLIRIEYRLHKRFLTNSKISRTSRIKRLFYIFSRRCPEKKNGCGLAYVKHSNCAYVDELSNYNYCCKNCHEEIDTMYQEWWDEYYSSIY